MIRATRSTTVGLVAALVLGACDGGPSDTDTDSDTDLPVPLPTLTVWMPESGPPGVWLDGVVSAQGDLGEGDWTLSIEGLPEGMTAVFEPAAISAAQGAMLRIDVAIDAPLSQGPPAVVAATSGARRIETQVPLGVVDFDDGAPDFGVQVRLPVHIGPTGAIEMALSGSEVEVPGQVASINGFEGDVVLLSYAPEEVVTLTPEIASVAPGAPTPVTLRSRITDEGAWLGLVAVSRRTWRAADDHPSQVTVDADPGVRVLPTPRVWVAPGGSASADVTVDAWGVDTAAPSISGGTAPGVTVSVGAIQWLVAPVTFSASGGAAPGPRDLALTASVGGQEAEGRARVVVTGPPSAAFASAEILAPPLPFDTGPNMAFGLDIFVDATGVEFGWQDADGVWRAREANGFAAEFQGGPNAMPTVHLPGVLGGRVTVKRYSGTIGVIETRSDVGTREWSLPGGSNSRVAAAYDSANVLWVATTVDPGVLRIWKLDTAGYVPVEVSGGLPTTVLDAGPWLAAGDVPTVVYAHDGAFHAMQSGGSDWFALSGTGLPALSTFQGDLEVATDGANRPVIAWVDDAAIHVARLDGTWVELGPLPYDATQVPREVALVVDGWDAPLLAWIDASYVPPPQAPLRRFSSEVWFTRWESDAWRAPAPLQLDPTSDARFLRAMLGPDGRLVVSWAEDSDFVVMRGIP